ncbi:hypothetical protein JHK82_039315 [Glycine max]|nr:hypothetical protein JHK86_039492 [Glycine max]KAG5110092.1 hypothetical protein JHK82_039315 [Glycine max]KAG5121377.1 hypothetical protein JHK84_039717 [Glycine max]
MQWPNEEVEKLRDKQVSIMREKLVGESTIEVSGIPASQMNRSIIESLREKGRICITSRVYPSFVIDKDAHLYVFYNGSQSVVISELNAWSMKQAKFGQEESIVKLYGINLAKGIMEHYSKGIQDSDKPRKLLEDFRIGKLITGNIHRLQVGKIEAEKMLIQMVETELEKRKQQGTYKGGFRGQSHFFGYSVYFRYIILRVVSYEGRCGLPTNFDSTYCYALGYGAVALLQSGKTGLISSICANALHIIF